MDIANGDGLNDLVATGFDVVVNFAARVGGDILSKTHMPIVNLTVLGANVLEAVRHAKPRPFLVKASSNPVYGNSTEAPFSEEVRVDSPVALHAAAKRAGVSISETYTNLYELPQVGLRFFTVHGRW